MLKSMIPSLDKVAMVMNGNNANDALKSNKFVPKPTAWASKS